MDKIKEQIATSTNGATPDDVMSQIAVLLQAAGYEGLGVVAIGPRGSAVNPLEFLPTGDWRLQVVPVKARE